jgi:fermentation-respiration switch protein FrsA (DUF1100 family)
MLRLLHLILMGLYLILPLAAVVAATWRRRRGNPAPLAALIVTGVIAFLISLSLNVIYSNPWEIAGPEHARISFVQIVLGTWFAAGLLLLLKLFDLALRLSLRRVLRIRLATPEENTPGRTFRIFIASVLRVAVLFGVALPYVIAVVLTYRAKVLPVDDPQSRLGLAFERVEFRSTDGVKLVGWWIPASRPDRSGISRSDWAKNTVLLCHGLDQGKSNELRVARRLVSGGLNVLAFDFRAHGESGGQLTTFGDLERRDVLGAVRWARQAHPEMSQKIFGAGAGTGAAALIGAAADDSDEGRAIGAIAAYAPFDRFSELARDMARRSTFYPLDWVLRNETLPMASVQSGADLLHFAPADEVSRLWPRPILFIQSERDEIIAFERGRELYDAAVQPKYYVWFPRGEHHEILTSDIAAGIVLEFFRSAAPHRII